MLYGFYGDDFTGSTDVLEALALGGVEAALLVGDPTPDALARLGGLDAVGIAGMSRAMTPAQMDASLPAAFAALRALGPPVVHYKVCSTFDSSPDVGSIGRAIEIGRRAVGGRLTPLVVGAPALGRYCVFGNLFAEAGMGSAPVRLDRHPVMSRHPVTPMLEADLRRHLAAQTSLRVGLVDVLALDRGAASVDAILDAVESDGADAVLFDAITEEHLLAIGCAVWARASARPPLFAAGSSGLTHALARRWRTLGLVHPRPIALAGPVDRLLVGSGSCSVVTARQIERALAAGFVDVALDAAALMDGGDDRRAIDAAVDALERGRSAILHLARGPDDPRIAAARASAARCGRPAEATLGRALGRALRAVVERHRPPRLAIAGGDTSGCVAAELGIDSLRMVAPLAPGGPLCRAASRASAIDGILVVFKGGQVGSRDFFASVLAGRLDSHEPNRKDTP